MRPSTAARTDPAYAFRTGEYRVPSAPSGHDPDRGIIGSFTFTSDERYVPMNFDAWTIYAGVVPLFMIAPGSSHFPMIATGLESGFGRSLATTAGDLPANAIRMTSAGFGLAAAVVASRHGFAMARA